MTRIFATNPTTYHRDRSMPSITAEDKKKKRKNRRDAGLIGIGKNGCRDGHGPGFSLPANLFFLSLVHPFSDPSTAVASNSIASYNYLTYV